MQKIKQSKPGNHVYALSFKNYLREKKLCVVAHLKRCIEFTQNLKPSDKYFSGFLTNELRVTSYELRVTIYCTSHELNLSCELQVTIYSTNWIVMLIVEVSLLYQLFISMACSLQNQLFLISYSWAMYLMKECSRMKL